MDLNTLTAISPIDGRYRRVTNALTDYFSEFALIKYRVEVEVEYFIALCEIPLPQLSDVDHKIFDSLRSIYTNFTEADALSIKEIEKTTNHDVKAVEYFLKDKFEALGLTKHIEFIHFGLTSQDINNTAIPLSLKRAMHEVIEPSILEVKNTINEMAEAWKNISMLAKTHGQPASPTRLGKEMQVFSSRIEEQMILLGDIPFAAKFGGATGNFNAHHVAYPAIDWIDFGNEFVKESLGLQRSHPTTQIEHYDHIAAIFDNLKRIKAGEVGSSAMPHKVNPIDFENAEGNLGIANAIFEHLSAKLPISRLQRDLTDSTVLRNIGVPLGHTLIALKSLEKGIKKLELNQAAIDADLEDNWAVVAEAIQTILRREGYPKPYEALKGLTRTNQKITAEVMKEFIQTLEVSAEIKNELMQISPFNYTGL